MADKIKLDFDETFKNEVDFFSSNSHFYTLWNWKPKVSDISGGYNRHGVLD